MLEDALQNISLVHVKNIVLFQIVTCVKCNGDLVAKYNIN